MIFTLPVIAESTPGVFYAFSVSDFFGKFIVVLLLLISIWAWWTMIDKGLALYRAMRMSIRFLNAFTNRENIVGSLQDAQRTPCPLTDIYMVGLERLLSCYFDNPEQAARFISRAGTGTASGTTPERKRLTGAQIEAIETVMEREVSAQILSLEEGVPTLGTVVSLGPFLGLLGTVWGVMMAFCAVAIAGKPDFAALAPGVSGALLTTVAGLVVAIPSLLGYNFLVKSVRKLTVYMDNFTEDFMAKVKNEQLAAGSRGCGESANLPSGQA